MIDQSNFPIIGQLAPHFEALSNKGIVRFPNEFQENQWCILFAHPANFTGAWVMYSTFLALKEKYFTERNCKLLGLCCEPVGPDGEGTWAEFGGEFVDTNHKDMWDLAKEFGIELTDYAQVSETALTKEVFFFKGKKWLDPINTGASSYRFNSEKRALATSGCRCQLAASPLSIIKNSV